MAIGNSTSRGRGRQTEEQKATGFVNVFIGDASGKRKKVGSIALQSGNPVHEQIDNFLRQNPEDGVERLVSKLDIEYNPVDDTPPDLGLDSL